MASEGDKSGRDLYAVLELAPDATLDEIRRAFRTLAAKNHPDRFPGDAKVALRFKQINAAYQVLSDTERRFQYDQLTAPIEELAMVPRQPAASPYQEQPPPEVHRRRSRRTRSGGRVAWALFGTAIALLAAAILVPDSHPAGFGDKPAAVATTDDLAASVETTRSPHVEAPPLPEDPPPGRMPPRAPSAPESDLPMRTVNGDRWTFVLPSNWQDAADAKGPRWNAPGDIGGYKPNVRLEVSSFPGEAAKYFTDLDKKLPAGVVIEAESWESDTTPDGLKREAKVMNGGAIVGKFIQYVVAVRGRGYVLTCNGPSEAFERVRPLCERILGSLRIK